MSGVDLTTVVLIADEPTRRLVEAYRRDMAIESPPEIVLREMVEDYVGLMRGFRTSTTRHQLLQIIRGEGVLDPPPVPPDPAVRDAAIFHEVAAHVGLRRGHLYARFPAWTQMAVEESIRRLQAAGRIVINHRGWLKMA